MKQFKKRGLALGLALMMGMTPLAAASEAMGNEIHGNSLALSVGTHLTKQIFWSDTYSDLRTERYFTYTPNAKVTPTVVYGDKVINRATLTAMAKTLESEGRRVIGGMNGDLYVIATGAPLGMVVTDGLVRSVPGSNNYGYHAVGFRGDGTAFIGKPELAATVTFKGLTYHLDGGINKIRSVDNDYVLYTSDFAATTQNSEPGVDVILTPVLENIGQIIDLDLDVQNVAPNAAADTAPVTDNPADAGEPVVITEVRGTVTQSEQLVVGGRVTYQVEQVLNSTGAVPIPEGKAILSINNKSKPHLVEQLKLLQPGDRVDLDLTTKEAAWTEADQAMGGLYRLVTNGQAAGNLASYSTERTAYSAVGVKADGTAVFYTVDGKQPGYSIGATLTQLAMRMVELGCVDAVSLDGGGSTTIGATYPDGGNMGTINKPSDGKERSNSVAIFLTTGMKASGTLGGVYVTPNDNLLLSGTKVQLKAQGLDTNYYTMNLPGQAVWSVENGDGSVSADGIFTAGGTNGVTQVTATANNVLGSAAMTVVNTPDKISLVDATSGGPVTALAMNPNGKVDLNAVASYKNLGLTSQDACFTWSLDPAVGTVDAEGVITAGGKSAGGNLTVTAGGNTITIPVAVAGHVNTLEGFESGITSTTAAGGLTLTQEKSTDRVRYGGASLRADYDAAQGAAASIVTTLIPAAGETFLNLWVFGDGSQNSLTATFADGQGVTQEVMVSGLDFTGWKYVEVEIPAGATALRSVNLLYGDGEKTKGAFWLDQLTTSNERLSDTTPPVVTVKRTDNQLTATVADFMDKKFTAAQVEVTYDGKVITSTFDPATATVKATLPTPDGKLHRVAVTATDASGNIGRSALNVDAAPASKPVFSDAAGHWAEAFAVYLYDRKVTTGVPGPGAAGATPTLLFQPDKAITRGELFAMVTRWLGVDITKYESTILPFADADKIPEWALPGVKAMYALGYLKGSAGADGQLYANVGTDISRAEAMTILGRVQKRGYAVAELTFADAGLVPDWAASYVKTLVGQGVVSGAEGNMIFPNNPIKRGEVAKILFSMT